MTENQPSLFPEQNDDQVDAQVVPFDQAAAAAHIAENARDVEYEDRTSEAARTEGHGPVEPGDLDKIRSLRDTGDAGTEEAIVASQGRHPSSGTNVPKKTDLRLVGIRPDFLPEHVETYHMSKGEIAELHAQLRAKGK